MSISLVHARSIVGLTLVLLAGCGGSCTGLSEVSCGASSQGYGANCGGCGTYRCLGDELVCLEPESPRRDLALVLEWPLLTTPGFDELSGFASLLEPEATEAPLERVLDRASACLPGLSEPKEAQIRLVFRRAGLDALVLVSGPRALIPGTSLALKSTELTLELPDVDHDGAVNALELALSSSASATVPTEVPRGFRSTPGAATAFTWFHGPYALAAMDDIHQLLVLGLKASPGGGATPQAYLVDPATLTVTTSIGLGIAALDVTAHASLTRFLVVGETATQLLTLEPGDHLLAATPVPVPTGFIALGPARTQGSSSFFVGGKTAASGAILRIDPNDPSAAVVIGVPETQGLGRSVEAGGLLLALEPEASAVVAIRLGPPAELVSRRSFDSAPDDLVALDREVWVSLPERNAVARVPLDPLGRLSAEDRVELPDRPVALSADGEAGVWLYVALPGSLARISVPFRRLETVIPLGGAASAILDVDATASGLVVALSGSYSLVRVDPPRPGLFSEGALPHASRSSAVELGPGPSKVIGFLAREDQGQLEDRPGDRVEDLYRASVAEAAVVVLACVRWNATLLLSLIGEDDRILALGANPHRGLCNQALVVEGAGARLFGVSGFDQDGETARLLPYTLQIFPFTLAEARPEREPNEAPAGLVEVTLPAMIQGDVAPSDLAEVSVPLPNGADRLEDLYRLPRQFLRVSIVLETKTAGGDLDLYVLDASGQAIARPSVIEPGVEESVTLEPNVVEAGVLIGVTAWDGAPLAPRAAYRLHLLLP